MIRQREFYQAIQERGRSQLKARFRQNSDPVEAGYLPGASSGTCSYTTLDFHRAVSQGCEQEWMNTAEQAKKSSSVMQFLRNSVSKYTSQVSEGGNDFGRRQQVHYVDQTMVIKDKLYLRSLPKEKQTTLKDSVVPNSRHQTVQMECFSPKEITSELVAQLESNSQASLRLSFDLNVIDSQSKVTPMGGHAIGICQSRDGKNLYVMDPNVGVIATTKNELGAILDALQFSLYKDFTLGEANVEIQDKVWIDPDNPPSPEDVDLFREEEEVLLTSFTAERYKAYKEEKLAEPVVDCSFDEAIFSENAWANAKPVVVAVSAVDVSSAKIAPVSDFRAVHALAPEIIEAHKQVLAHAHDSAAAATPEAIGKFQEIKHEHEHNKALTADLRAPVDSGSDVVNATHSI